MITYEHTVKNSSSTLKSFGYYANDVFTSQFFPLAFWWMWVCVGFFLHSHHSSFLFVLLMLLFLLSVQFSIFFRTACNANTILGLVMEEKINAISLERMWVRMIHINSQIEDWFADDFCCCFFWIFKLWVEILSFRPCRPHLIVSIIFWTESFCWSVIDVCSIFFSKKKPLYFQHIQICIWALNILSVGFGLVLRQHNAYRKCLVCVWMCWSLMLPECTKFWLSLLCASHSISSLFALSLYISLAFALSAHSILGIVKYHSDVYHIF